MTDELSPPPVPDEKVLPLRRPITYPPGTAGLTYTELHLTEPTMKQLRAASGAGSALDQLAALIQQNAAVPMGVVDQLQQRDVEAASDFFASFGSASP